MSVLIYDRQSCSCTLSCAIDITLFIIDGATIMKGLLNNPHFNPFGGLSLSIKFSNDSSSNKIIMIRRKKKKGRRR